MNVVRLARHGPWVGRAGKPEWTCSELCTLYVRTTNLYMIPCWTIPMQLVHVAAWHAIPSTPGAQFQLHLSEFSTVSGWCRSVHSVAVVEFYGQDFGGLYWEPWQLNRSCNISLFSGRKAVFVVAVLLLVLRDCTRYGYGDSGLDWSATVGQVIGCNSLQTAVRTYAYTVTPILYWICSRWWWLLPNSKSDLTSCAGGRHYMPPSPATEARSGSLEPGRPSRARWANTCHPSRPAACTRQTSDAHHLNVPA